MSQVSRLYLCGTRMITTLEKHYEENCASYRGALEQHERKASLLSRLRLGVFLSLAPVIIFWGRLPLPGLFVLGLIALFLWLVRLHEDAKEARRVAQWLLKLNEEELLYLREHRFPSVPVNQPPQEHKFAADLDLFGDQSAFHLVNRAVTIYGREQLASALTADPLQPGEILRRQEAIRELAGDEKFRQHFLAMGRDEGLRQNDLSGIVEWLGKEDKELQLSWFPFVQYAWPVLSIGAGAACWYYDKWSWFTPVALIAWGVVGSYKKKTDKVHNAVSGQHRTLSRFSGLFADLAAAGFKAPLLTDLQAQAREANAALKKLAAITERFDSRKNILGNVLLNTFGMYDIACLRDLEKWKRTHRASLGEWIIAIGKTEMLISAATFHFNHPQYCFPEVVQGPVQLSAVQLAHPLIPPAQRVGNDIAFVPPKKLFFITGSNMSGKSTFLRALGINLALAQAGFPVCAEKFSFTPMQILTSIRISDSLRENTSLFYAELLKLRQVLDELEKGGPCFVLLDEILRGTNSADKYHGAYHFIQKLIRHNALVVFATHDLKLCELHGERPDITENYRFEGIIEGEELIFPYRIEHGVVQNRTASFLMKQLRLVD